MVSLDPAALADLARAADGYVAASKAESTLRGYRSDWRGFTAWCADRGLDPLPADAAVVAMYLTDKAETLKVGTLQRHMSSIAAAHRAAGHPSPTRHDVVRDVWQGIRRTFGVRSTPKAALVTADVRTLVGCMGTRLIDVRDRALLLVCFSGALRRSELVALDVADVEDTADGLVVRLRRSKTDQDGRGASLGLPYGSDPATCPVRALRAWLTASGITEGPIFRRVDRHGRLLERMSGRAAADRIKAACERAGWDPAIYSGMSLRRGFITSAARAGTSERVIMRHSRHKSVVVFRTYVEETGLFTENAAATVGL